MVATDGHEGGEEGDGPKSHKYYPGDDEGAKVGGAENLEIEERYGCLDETDGENSGYDERIVVLVVCQQIQ